LEEIFPKKIFFVNPKTALQNNIIFHNSLILPRMNTIQNYILAKNILNNYLINNSELQRNIFITSGRNERISNIEEVINFFQKINYEIVYPDKTPIKELLLKIKYSKILISEKASLINNIHLCRDSHYYILSSKNEIINDNKKFCYAGIYKSLHKGLYEDIFCDDDPALQNNIPYKNRIKVDINLLKEKFNNN
jgi:capsular polysaccharide biosynthesis protein